MSSMMTADYSVPQNVTTFNMELANALLRLMDTRKITVRNDFGIYTKLYESPK